jgi:hypothetical protein
MVVAVVMVVEVKLLLAMVAGKGAREKEPG